MLCTYVYKDFTNKIKNNLNIHQQENGYIKYNIIKKWKTIQLLREREKVFNALTWKTSKKLKKKV